jgi:hypothetical protein
MNHTTLALVAVLVLFCRRLREKRQKNTTKRTDTEIAAQQLQNK